MKAVVINHFGGPEQLIYTEVPMPVPAEDEVLVENRLIGVGKPDYLVRSGNDPYLEDALPGLVIGNESSGIVREVGAKVKDLRPGDHVAVLNGTGCGSHAEFCCAKEQFVIPLPEDLPFEQLAGILNLQVAYALLHDAGKGTDGQSLYISGAAGGIGTVLIQMAKAENMTVIAGASSEEKCAVLRELGADLVLNTSTADVKEEILRFTDGRGVDLIYDQLCGPQFARQYDYLADFGMIVLYNWLEGDPQLNQLDTIVRQAPHASAVRAFSYHAFDDKPQRRLANAQRCFELVREGKVRPYIAQNLPLSEARTAHELLDSGKVIGKLVMHP